jgi:hypothetical protein
MTPKEKAEQLVKKYRVLARYSGGTGDTIPAAKQCALIAVDEVIESYKTKDLIYPKEIIYYQEVKQEIEKL